MSEFLHIYAKDENGDHIKADDAVKGHNYYCPVCKQEFILKKSNRVGKGTKRPHFAHKSLTPNCTPESALHYLFKNLLADRLNDYIITNRAFNFSWHCSFCGRVHHGNLLKKIKSIKIEHDLMVCKPDIALLDDNDKVFAVIEIVVTHPPEEKALRFYENSKIILIQINLTSDDNLFDMDKIIARKSNVNICFNPKCEKCGRYQYIKEMTIIDGECMKCGNLVKIAKLSASNWHPIRGRQRQYAYDFTPDELNFAKSKGVLFNNDRRTVCKKCGWYIDDFHIFTDYWFPAELGEIPSEKFDIGYHCDHVSQHYDE